MIEAHRLSCQLRRRCITSLLFLFLFLTILIFACNEELNPLYVILLALLNDGDVGALRNRWELGGLKSDVDAFHERWETCIIDAQSPRRAAFAERDANKRPAPQLREPSKRVRAKKEKAAAGHA